MAKTWTDQDVRYLKRYAKTKTTAALAERFDTDEDAVREKLAELDLAASDHAAATGPDPEVALFEEGLTALHEHDWKTAAARFERVLAESDRLDVAARARQYLGVVRRASGETVADGGDGNAYNLAVYHRNRGALGEAMQVVEKAGGKDEDGRFAYLAASLHSLQGETDKAVAALERAIERDPTNRVRAFHDTDFADLRQDHADLFGLD